jgi:hypothetical protein
MSISLKAVAGVTAAAVVGASMVGCSSNSKSPTTSSSSGSATSTSHSSASNSAQPQSGDYTKLLIQASDLNAPEEFKASPITQNPNGNAGVETTFSNEDGSNVIRDTIIVMNDPSAAASALDSAKAKLGDSVKGTPGPAAVGTGGTTVSGNSPDGSKGVTMVLFTEGKVFTTLKFDGPPDTPAPPDFVTDVAQKQDTAIKNGLPG